MSLLMPRSRLKNSLVAGIDLGGTNMQIGIVDRRNRIIGREGRKTKSIEGKAEVIRRIVRGIERACENAGVGVRELAAVGIAAPGAIDIPRGVVLEAPNLKWYNVPLRDLLQKALKCKVVVDNDVNGAVWGESQLGAARGKPDALGVWMGTGVGGGLVLNGKLHYGEFFTAGEVGQTTLFPYGKLGRRTVEDFCSRTGLSRTIHERLPKNRRSLLNEITHGTGKITGSRQLGRAYKKRDSLAVSVVNESADLLGIAIAGWITVLAIDTVVIGGGVSEALGSPYLRRITASFKRRVFPKRCRKCRLVMTHLKDDAGLLGAALLARQALRT